MDNNISLQVKKLIEVDKSAVELEHKRERELQEMEQHYKEEMNRINLQLSAAKEESQKVYEQFLQQAQKEAAAINEAAMSRLSTIEQNMNCEVEAIAAEWWSKILGDLK